MDKQTLKQLVSQGLSSYKIARTIGLSQTATFYWLRRHGLVTQRLHKCSCGEIDPTKFSPGRFTECRKCRVFEQVGRNKKYKQELVAYKGGKCEICGYNKCLAALDFHHKNPKEKDPNWKRMRSWTPSRVKKEIDKCQLVCSNCHAEIHYGSENQDVV